MPFSGFPADEMFAFINTDIAFHLRITGKQHKIAVVHFVKLKCSSAMPDRTNDEEIVKFAVISVPVERLHPHGNSSGSRIYISFGRNLQRTKSILKICRTASSAGTNFCVFTDERISLTCRIIRLQCFIK